MSSNFCVINLGCKVNRVEADSMSACLLAAGACQSALADADIVIINTCTVTGEADAKSRKALRRALRQAPASTVIVCGCGAAADPDQFKEESGRYEVIANKETALERAGELLGLALQGAPRCAARVGEGFATRVAIKVQDGCDNACSYCIVPLARGAARSLPLDQVTAEIAAHVKAGVQEIVLTGIDLGSYQAEAKGLDHLLDNVLKQGDMFRLRLSSIELPSITEELIEQIASAQGRICAHLHIPLQSGSDALLIAMNRRYDVAQYLDKIARIKTALPHIAFTTDVIVGFPGESEQDFSDTLAVCKDVGFSRIHIFRYSKRPKTAAAALPGQIKAEQTAERAGRLRAMAGQLTREDAEGRIGSEELVVLETARRGRSESYYPVRLAKNAERGTLVTMKIAGYEQGELIAEER